nr:MAG TPA: chromosome segregation protein [Caudoviricetes sp.]
MAECGRWMHGTLSGSICFALCTMRLTPARSSLPCKHFLLEVLQMDIISKKLANNRLYAYHGGRFWFWDEGRSIWKESHLLAKKYNLNHEYDKLLTPEDFLSDPSQFQALEDYEVDYILKSALQNAQPCKNAPIDPVEETAVVPAQAASPAATAEDKPAAPSFDFGADDQTNALLLQDAQTFITGNMARIMAAKHAHDLTANHYKGSWGKWCAAVGISRDTGDNMVRVAEQFGNIQLEGKSIFDVQPMKLLYAAAKPSTPEEVKQAVFTGDITTYKEYQEVMAQLKAKEDELAKTQADLDHEISQNDALLDEKGRLLRECEASKKARMDAENRADTAEGSLTAAMTDVQGLTEQNARLNAEKEQAEARAHKAEDALKHQPIAGVVDEEEVDRRAAEKAWGLADARNRELQEENDRLKKNSAQLERRMKAMTSRMDDLGQTDFETANHCPEAMLAIWNSCKGSYSRLTGEDLENTFQYICNTLNSIRQEAALLCRQPEGYDGGAA